MDYKENVNFEGLGAIRSVIYVCMYVCICITACDILCYSILMLLNGCIVNCNNVDNDNVDNDTVDNVVFDNEPRDRNAVPEFMDGIIIL